MTITKPVFRMSQSGFCQKRLSAMLLGSPEAAVPSWLQMAAEEGNWHEQRMKQELRELGCEIVDEQRELSVDYASFTLVGHIDALVMLSRTVLDSSAFEVHLDPEVDLSLFMLLEVKTFGFLEHQRWLKGMFEAYPQYEAQKACYMHTLGLDAAAYAVKDRSGGARRLYIMREGRSSIADIIEKLGTVVWYATEGELAPAEFDPTSIECRRCQYRATLCSSTKVVVTDVKVIEAAADYLEGSTMRKLGDDLAQSAKEVLVGFAQQNNVIRWNAGPYSVSYSHYPRESISIKRLGAIMPREAFEEAISVSEVDRVRVVSSEVEDD